MRKRIYVGILAVMLCITMFNVAAINIGSAVDSSPIYITHNDNFTLYADSGVGTENDPYIISDLSVVNYGSAGIWIQDTDAYVNFINLTIYGNGFYGMYLYGVSNINFTIGAILDMNFGVELENCSRIVLNNVTVNDRDATSLTTGIKITESDNIGVWNCHIGKSDYGLSLQSSFRLSIQNNTFVDCGITFLGTHFVSDDVKIINCTTNGRPIGYLNSVNDRMYDISAYGQVLLVNTVNITLYNGVISNVTSGAEFIFTQDCILAYTNISNCYTGLVLYESVNVNILHNNFVENVRGIFTVKVVGGQIHENNFIDNSLYGIWIYSGSSSITIYSNNFINSVVRDDGAKIESSLTWVAGRFVNSVSGWPLSNVSVLVERAGRNYTAYTNENGVLRLPVPVLGEYDLTISKFRYQTKTPTVNIDSTGIHLFEVNMNKADLGPGTGFVQARFMDGVTPVEGASIRVYSYLDGAYYFHSNYTSDSTFPGWVNITGLYYDRYVFVVDHPNYERKIIQQTVIEDGLAGIYDNIQLTEDPLNAYVWGGIYDSVTDEPLEGVTVTMVSSTNNTFSGYTDENGFVNITGLPVGIYSTIYELDDYHTESAIYEITHGGDQSFNPVYVWMTSITSQPEILEDFVVNDWDDGTEGNYWDSLSVLHFALAEDAIAIPGDNPDNPTDDYPTSVEYELASGPVDEYPDEEYPEIIIPDEITSTTTTIPVTTTTTTTTTIPTVTTEDLDVMTLMLLFIGGIAVMVVIVLVFKRKF